MSSIKGWRGFRVGGRHGRSGEGEEVGRALGREMKVCAIREGVEGKK